MLECCVDLAAVFSDFASELDECWYPAALRAGGPSVEGVFAGVAFDLEHES